MPFINVKVSVPLTEEKRIAVKAALGKSIAVMGKSEDYLMVGFEENVPLYFAGEKEEKCAFVDVRVFGAVDPDQASDMTKLICQTLEMVNIAGRRSRLPGGGGATCPDFWSRPACLLVILLFRDPIRRALS